MRPSKARATRLVGLKENVIIGKLIPASTGLRRYRNVTIHATDEPPVLMTADGVPAVYGGDVALAEGDEIDLTPKPGAEVHSCCRCPRRTNTEARGVRGPVLTQLRAGPQRFLGVLRPPLRTAVVKCDELSVHV